MRLLPMCVSTRLQVIATNFLALAYTASMTVSLVAAPLPRVAIFGVSARFPSPLLPIPSPRPLAYHVRRSLPDLRAGNVTMVFHSDTRKVKRCLLSRSQNWFASGITQAVVSASWYFRVIRCGTDSFSCMPCLDVLSSQNKCDTGNLACLHTVRICLRARPRVCNRVTPSLLSARRQLFSVAAPPTRAPPTTAPYPPSA